MSRAKKRSKTSRLAVPDADESWPDRPTEAEYNNMKSYQTFSVPDEEGVEHEFTKGQVALVLPHRSDPKKEHQDWTYWVAKIKEIKSKDEDNSVWVRVQWFYSGKDVSDVIKSFNSKAVGPTERIFSDHFDLIQPDCFERVISMYKFDEIDPEQKFIPIHAFYRRYTLEYRSRNIHPKQGQMTCTCRHPYNPNDPECISLMHFCPRPSCRRAYHHGCLVGMRSKESRISNKESQTVKIPHFSGSQEPNAPDGGRTIKVMRSARKHAAPVKKTQLRSAKALRDAEDEAEVVRVVTQSSSTKAAAQKTSSGPPQSTSLTLTPRDLRLLACSPDTDDTLDLEALIPQPMDVDSDAEHVSETEQSDEEMIQPKKKARGPPPKKHKGKKVAAPRRGRTERRSLGSVLASIPHDLLAIAIQPLVRGGAFVNGGVAGNIGMVTSARRLVYTALQMGDGRDAVPDWKDEVFDVHQTVGMQNAIVHVTFDDGGPAKKDKGLPAFVCPNCKSAI